MRPRPLSQLIHARIQAGTSDTRIITLHPHNQFAEDVKEITLGAAPDATILGLESYKGVYVGKTITGYTWYVGPYDQPAPLFYGDALAEIERFLWDEVDRQHDAGMGEAALPVLLGVEQGAVMALGAAAAVPDLLSGVIAIDGMFPIVPGWDPPLAPLADLPVLLVESPSARTVRPDVLTGEGLEQTLTAWGARVTRMPVDDADADHLAAGLRAWLAGQPVRRMARHAGD
ncbi:MAG: hypothetical protein WBA46_10745 [Thermomicrobiales bacterium]